MDDPQRFASSIRELVVAWGSDVVLPVTDQSSAALLPNRNGLGRAVVPGPDAAAFNRIIDKQQVLAEAAKLGIGTPPQIVVLDPSERHVLDDVVQYPVVVKPSTSLQKGRRWPAQYAEDRATLKTIIAATPADGFPLLIQKRIIGWGCGMFMLIWDGSVLATFAHRRLRELPPSGGASVLSESIPADPVLVASSRELLQQFGWQGVAMVEYKIEDTTGRPYLMEVNGRLWGSLQLAIDSGVDFPALLVAAATGQAVLPQAPYRVGVRLTSFWRDFLHLYLRLRWDSSALHLPPGAPGRAKVFWETIRWRTQAHDDVWRWRDPLPFFSGTAAFWRDLLKREL
jgi:predicted ATP-grasp superfamily ATP-dependent carboligase